MKSGNLWALFDFPSTRIFYNNRVCIIGDAAHAAPPSQGSGAALAMEDALVMSRLLLKVQTQDDVCAAFVGFNTVRHPPNMRQIGTAREAARITSFLEADVGNDVAKIMERMTHRWD